MEDSTGSVININKADTDDDTTLDWKREEWWVWHREDGFS